MSDMRMLLQPCKHLAVDPTKPVPDEVLLNAGAESGRFAIMPKHGATCSLIFCCPACWRGVLTFVESTFGELAAHPEKGPPGG